MLAQLDDTGVLPTREANISQIDSLQILRAVAVFLVAWLHAGQILGDWREVELPHFYAFGIDIFFVISGFIMSLVLLRTRQESGLRATWGFLKRRLIRIFPIYWVYALLRSARLLHAHGFSKDYLPSFLLLPGLYPRFPLVVDFSWTMVFEMYFYYALAAILLVTVQKAVPVSIAFFGGMVLLGTVLNVQRSAWITFSSPLVLEFVLGAVVALAFVRFGQQRRWGIVMLLVGAALSLYLRADPSRGGAGGIGMATSSDGAVRHVFTWGLAATSIVSGVVFWSPTIRSLPGRVAVVLGNSSYSAYLASSLLIELACRPLLRWGGHATLGKEWLLQFLIVAFVLSGGWVSYKFVEKPMIRQLRRGSE